MFRKIFVTGAVVLGTAFAVPAAYAQSQADCAAGIEEVNNMIAAKTSSQTPGDNAKLDEARGMSQEAQSAHDAGEYGRCMELVGDAKMSITGVK